MMKVRFDATFEDFVDVCRRSQETSWSSYIVLIIVVVAFSVVVSWLLHWIFQSWLITVMAALGGSAAGIYSVIGSRDKQIRDHLRKQVDEKIPTPTEVEINDEGVSTRCLGHTVVQEWSIMETIEETDDAIYFRNKFGHYCSVRKRGFGSEYEMTEFLQRARSFLRQDHSPERTVV